MARSSLGSVEEALQFCRDDVASVECMKVDFVSLEQEKLVGTRSLQLRSPSSLAFLVSIFLNSNEDYNWRHYLCPFLARRN